MWIGMEVDAGDMVEIGKWEERIARECGSEHCVAKLLRGARKAMSGAYGSDSGGRGDGSGGSDVDEMLRIERRVMESVIRKRGEASGKATKLLSGLFGVALRDDIEERDALERGVTSADGEVQKGVNGHVQEGMPESTGVENAATNVGGIAYEEKMGGQSRVETLTDVLRIAGVKGWERGMKIAGYESRAVNDAADRRRDMAMRRGKRMVRSGMRGGACTVTGQAGNGSMVTKSSGVWQRGREVSKRDIEGSSDMHSDVAANGGTANGAIDGAARGRDDGKELVVAYGRNDIRGGDCGTGFEKSAGLSYTGWAVWELRNLGFKIKQIALGLDIDRGDAWTTLVRYERYWKRMANAGVQMPEPSDAWSDAFCNETLPQCIGIGRKGNNIVIAPAKDMPGEVSDDKLIASSLKVSEGAAKKFVAYKERVKYLMVHRKELSARKRELGVSLVAMQGMDKRAEERAREIIEGQGSI